ncbi:MAG: type II secretion system protein [Planctomycetota bacterium]|jgi:general secretion pathway protein G
MRAKSGFTLVEILIVVVILGILAAIVIPQFTDASSQARESSLASDLQTLRSQLELYKIQHGEQFPWDAPVGFELAMTTKTDKDGNTWVDFATSGTAYGRYMQKLPSNPFIDFNFGDPDGFTFAAAPPLPSDGSTGWWVNTTDGEVRANDNWDKDGVAGPDHADL